MFPLEQWLQKAMTKNKNEYQQDKGTEDTFLFILVKQINLHTILSTVKIILN